MSSTLFAAPTVVHLGQEHPEWRPWLALLDVVASEATARAWAEAVPAEPAVAAPRLAGCALDIERGVAERWLGRLFEASGVEALRETSGRTDALSVLQASVNLDAARLADLARDADAPVDAFSAVTSLAAVPWLEACARLIGSAPGAVTGWCPTCGAWPTLAEERGLERERRLRCGRCGGDWRTEWLTCPVCGIDDHTRLASLVADALGESRRIDACQNCSGYLKTLTTLAPADAATLRLLDLSTVDLDVAALGRGFTRPAGLGHPLDVTVSERRPTRRFWRR